MLSTKEATDEFRSLLEGGYYTKDRSVNTAEDYSEYKESRDTQACAEYANTEEFMRLCIREHFINE